MIFVSTREAAQLCGVSSRTIQLKIQARELPAISENRSNKIPLNSLPAEAQVKYVKMSKELIPEEELRLLSTPARLAAESSEVQIGLEVLASQPDAKARRNRAIYETARQKPFSTTKAAWFEGIAIAHGISIQSVYRIVAKMESERNLTSQGSTAKRTYSSWDREAVEYMQGYYLKAIRDVGNCSRITAYRAVQIEAENRGWQIGSRSSAYIYLKNLSPLLEVHARGGNRALDNYFYILRNLDALEPFQIIVGDQHIFDWWVKDEKGDIFRPQCYLWIDMCTRMIYGIAFDRKYSSSTVKMALHMGMKRFGKFGCTYNDNGRPELSKAMNEIIADLHAYGMSTADISDLYRSGDKYIVTDEDDNPVSVVESAQEWEKQHRRIFAQVKNAKAKPIERFFRSLETILDEMALPGKVKALSLSAAEEEQAVARLKKQETKLLTMQEFIVTIITALEKYEQRKHSSLKMQPREKLMEKYRHGWRPTFINETEVDFIFLERARRKVNRGRILIDGVSFIGDELTTDNQGDIDQDVGIFQYEGKSLEVRYDPHDLDKAFAITPSGQIRPLYRSKQYLMLDDQDANEALAWKRRQMKAVREAFKRLTSGIGGIVIQSAAAKEIKEARIQQKQESKKVEIGELQSRLASRREQSSKEKRVIKNFRPNVWESDSKRYRWCLDMIIQGVELNDTDRRFMTAYQETMDDGERAYWNTYKALGGNA